LVYKTVHETVACSFQVEGNFLSRSKVKGQGQRSVKCNCF